MCPYWDHNLINRPIFFWQISDCKHRVIQNESQGTRIGIIEDEPAYVPFKGWADMIRKVYEVDPILCPSCGGRMRIISFIEEPKTIDRIIRHLKLTFEAERPPPPNVVQQDLLMAAEEKGEYFWGLPGFFCWVKGVIYLKPLDSEALDELCCFSCLWPCRFGCYNLISGFSWVENGENCEEFGANPKTKYLNSYI